MFGLFGKNSIKNIEKSLEKYYEILREDINLVIRTRYNGKLYTSYVESIDKREVIFRCPSDEHDIIRFRNNATIKIEFICFGKLYSTEMLIKERIIKDAVVYYRGDIAAPIEENKRRKSYRLPIILDLTYTVLPAETEEYNGNSVDISAGGMLMETSENIHNKDIRVRVDIEGQVYIIKSTILKKRVNYRNGTYLYNLKFSNLSSRHKNQIHRFVMDNATA